MEKPPVVLDIGTSYTKAGYAGDNSPICILPSVVQLSGKEVLLRELKTEDEICKILRLFLRNIYLKQLLLSMNERPVVVCESLLSSVTWKKAMAKVLLVDFNVPSVVFAPRHLLSLYTLGIQSGLVLHSGFSESVVIPIYENMVLLSSCESFPYGGDAVENNLKQLLSELASTEKQGKKTPVSESEEVLSQKLLEDIKVRTCFITTYDRAKALREQAQTEGENSHISVPDPPRDVQYPIKGDTILHIPGRIRELACEVLYDHVKSEQTLAHLILDCLLKCPIDTRKTLAANVIVVGGNSMLPGFKSRLLQEVQQLSKDVKYASKMAVHDFSFHTSPVKENYTAWLGGSILGSCGNLELYSLNKEDFLTGPIPDWSNFIPDQPTSSYKTI